MVSRPISSVVDAITAIASRSGCRTAPRRSSLLEDKVEDLRHEVSSLEQYMANDGPGG